jgi:hypothetical protein
MNQQLVTLLKAQAHKVHNRYAESEHCFEYSLVTLFITQFFIAANPQYIWL